MQKFKVADGAAADGTALDRDGFTAGTRLLAKFMNDNQWNVFDVVEGAGYTLIDGDVSQLAKAVRAPYNATYTYNTSAIATQTASDVVRGSDGAYYEVLSDGVTNDDPVTNANGNWKKLTFKVADAVNVDEAISRQQIVTSTPLTGSNVDLLDGKQSNVTAAVDTIPIRDTDTAILGKNQCTAWIVFDATTTAPTILGSYNIGSIIKNAVGDFTLNFTNAFINANYSVTFGQRENYAQNGFVTEQHDAPLRTTTQLRIYSISGSTLVDFPIISVQVFGGK